jgi:hypothetical protein
MNNRNNRQRFLVDAIHDQVGKYGPETDLVARREILPAMTQAGYSGEPAASGNDRA